MEVDETVAQQRLPRQPLCLGQVRRHEPNGDETSEQEFPSGWFAKFPVGAKDKVNDFKPTAEAPFLGKGTRSDDAPSDRNGTERGDEVDLGPIQSR